MDVTATLEALLPASIVFAAVLLLLQFRHSAYKRRMNSFLQASLDGVLVVDMQRSVLFYNEAFAALWKLPSEVLHSQDDRSLLAHATAQLVDPDSYVAGVENAFVSEEARWHDLAVLKDGRIFERRSQPFWQNGVIKGRSFSFRDITERCRTEEALRSDARRHEAFSRMAMLSLDGGNVASLQKALLELLCQAVRADGATLVDLKSTLQDQKGNTAYKSTAEACDEIWRSREFAGYQLLVNRRGKGVFSRSEIDFFTNTVRLLEAIATTGIQTVHSTASQESLSQQKPGMGIAEQVHNADAAPNEHGKLQLLVVEDNPINQKVLVQMLKRADHRVDVANDGAEAVAMAARTTYDLILMDCQMPRMDGFDATRAIRAEGLNRRTNIVAVTANAFPEDRTRCLDAGMNDHVPKPLTKARLDETLNRWLHGQPQ